MPNMLGGDQHHPAYDGDAELGEHQALLGNDLYTIEISDSGRDTYRCESVDGKVHGGWADQAPAEVIALWRKITARQRGCLLPPAAEAQAIYEDATAGQRVAQEAKQKAAEELRAAWEAKRPERTRAYLEKLGALIRAQAQNGKNSWEGSWDDSEGLDQEEIRRALISAGYRVLLAKDRRTDYVSEVDAQGQTFVENGWKWVWNLVVEW